jgi:glycine cleavage system transcriptional repressor
MSHVAVMAIGEDRPGILAALAGALYDAGANLEDVSSTILRGHFASMLVVDLGDGLVEDLEQRLADAVRDMDVSVTVRPVRDDEGPRPASTHVLVAYAPDRPGIVATLTKLLADRRVNITDVSCRMVSPDDPVYTFVAEVEVPADVDEEALGVDVRRAADLLGVDVSFHPVDLDTL